MAIVNEIAAGNLIALEATGIALQRPFQDCVTEAAELLRRVLAETGLELQRPDRKPDDPLPFDGMLDIQTAREAKVMPLPIVSQGPAA